jgi:hypothetical protein
MVKAGVISLTKQTHKVQMPPLLFHPPRLVEALVLDIILFKAFFETSVIVIMMGPFNVMMMVVDTTGSPV